MDVLRSAHTVPALVGSDNDAESHIRWYRCKPGAQAFPGFHAFGSGVWEPDPEEWTQGPGVKSFPLTWKPSGILAPPGTEFHGREEWYERGIPQSVLDDPEGHTSPSCFPPPVALGVVAGMNARRSTIPNMCPECTNGVHLPTAMRLRFTEVVLNSAGSYIQQPPDYIPITFAITGNIDAYGTGADGLYSNLTLGYCNWNGNQGLTLYVNIATVFGIPIHGVGVGYGEWQYTTVQAYQSSLQFVRVYGCNDSDLAAPQVIGRCGWQQSGESVELTVTLEPVV